MALSTTAACSWGLPSPGSAGFRVPSAAALLTAPGKLGGIQNSGKLGAIGTNASRLRFLDLRLLTGWPRLQIHPHSDAGHNQEDTRVTLEPLRTRIIAQQFVQVAMHPIANHQHRDHLAIATAEVIVGH